MTRRASAPRGRPRGTRKQIVPRGEVTDALTLLAAIVVGVRAFAETVRHLETPEGRENVRALAAKLREPE